MTGVIQIDFPKTRRSTDKVIRAMLQVGTVVIAENTRGLEKDLEGITRVAVRGRLYRAWRSEAYPKSGGPARAPEGRVWVNGGERSQGAIKFFTETGRVTQRNGFYFAIPTNRAGSQGRARLLTPGEWERREGVKLRFVYRRGKPSLLVADDVTPSVHRGGAVVANTAKRRAAGRRSRTSVIFVLIPHIEKQGRFSVEPLIRRRQGMLRADYERRIKTAQEVR